MPIDRPRRHRVALSKPGRGLCQDISLLSKLAILPAKAAKLLALLAGYTVIATAAITVGLLDPAMDRRSARFELARQILNAAPGSCKGNNLFPELRRIWVPSSRMMTLSSHN